MDCSVQDGADAGEKIQACLDRLPSGGIADARNIKGAQVVSHTIALRVPGTVLLFGPRTVLNLADGVTIDIAALNIRIQGSGQTTVFRLGKDSAIRIGNNGQALWGWHLERVSIEPAPGKLPRAGVVLDNAREGSLVEVGVSHMPGAAIDVGDNCWSNRAIDVRIVHKRYWI